MHPIDIHTQRLLLKGITPQVIHTIFDSQSENEIKKFFGVDDKEYLRLKEMHEKGMETHRHSLFFFLLVEKDTNQPVGECGFHTWNSIHRRAELYYVLRNDMHKRKGYMTEVVPHVVQYGFEEMGLHRIEALVANWNTPSIKLLQKNQFVYEGIVREDYVVNDKNEDSDCYSLLKQEWQSHQSSASH
jgi:ribosomal-protein-alanine N-acetyltransferase